jgi:hypothetical protein
MAAMTSAPTSGLSRIRRFQAPSASVQLRKYRWLWMARRRASASGLAAAFVRAHSSRNSPSEDCRAFSTKRASAEGSTAPASATAAICATDNPPARAAAASAGSFSRRCAAASVSAASRTEVPVTLARWCAAERWPVDSQEPSDAARTAARPFTVAAIRSIATAWATTTAASSHESSAASKATA